MRIVTSSFSWKRPLVFRDYLVVVGCVLVLYSLSPHRFASHYSFIPKYEIERNLLQLTSPLLNLTNAEFAGQNRPLCDVGRVVESNEDVPMETWYKQVESTRDVQGGGEYIPKNCQPRFSVAILVPYRNREEHLDVFLNFFHNFLQRQNLHYRIFVIEQDNAEPFNRGKLFNIGSKYAEQFGFPCLVLHDVDLIPMNLGNIFACTKDARHMSSSLDSFRHNLPYRELFGGAVAIRTRTFKKTNGFSNIFKGWGGEDDDFYARIRYRSENICRFPPEYSRYTMLKHAKEVPNSNRNQLLLTGNLRFDSDGLNSLMFEQRALISRPLFTHILAV